MAEWKKIADTFDFETRDALQINVDGRIVALFSIGEEYYAVDDACTHAGASLAQGIVEGGDKVVCPWHGAKFNLKTGEALCEPAEGGIKVYPLKVDGKDIYIEI